MGIFREEKPNFKSWRFGGNKMIFPVCFSQIFCVCTSIFVWGVEENITLIDTQFKPAVTKR